MTEDDKEPMLVDSFGCSRQGNARGANGDQFVVADLKRTAEVHHASRSRLDDSRRSGARQAQLLLVADGVSGHPGAKIASGLVVDEVLDSVLNAVPWTPKLDLDAEASLRRELKETVVRCNDQVSGVARRFADRPEMATTLTMAFVRWPMAFIVHAGDSRAYLIRDGEITQLTTDHTIAQKLVQEGELDPEDAQKTRFAHMLWNAVGGDSRVTPELHAEELHPGDALVLCSDGLTSCLSDRSIRHLVETQESARVACEQLIAAVETIGGDDDTTVVVARFEPEVECDVPLVNMPDQASAASAVSPSVERPRTTAHANVQEEA